MERGSIGGGRVVAMVALSAAVGASLSGCATIATVQSVDAHSARMFSGTRLDGLAITGQPIPSRSFRVDPPPHPWLDLPFSFALDLVALPLTFGIGVNIAR